VGRGAEAVAAGEERQLDQEGVGDYLAAQALDDLAERGRGATGSAKSGVTS